MEVMEADKAREERRRGWKITAAVEAAAAEDDDGDEEEEEEKKKEEEEKETKEKGVFSLTFPPLLLFSQACASGSYAASAGAVGCTLCPAGFSCSDPAAAPVACGAGTFSEGGATTCTVCRRAVHKREKRCAEYVIPYF